jgi:hypothetical protein
MSRSATARRSTGATGEHFCSRLGQQKSTTSLTRRSLFVQSTGVRSHRPGARNHAEAEAQRIGGPVGARHEQRVSRLKGRGWFRREIVCGTCRNRTSQSRADGSNSSMRGTTLTSFSRCTIPRLCSKLQAGLGCAGTTKCAIGLKRDMRTCGHASSRSASWQERASTQARRPSHLGQTKPPGQRDSAR